MRDERPEKAVVRPREAADAQMAGMDDGLVAPDDETYNIYN
jgi:hypothetical protein